MNNLFEYMEYWEQSKSKIFEIEELEVCITDDLDNEIKSRYIEIVGNGLVAKATQWEDGFLELNAVDEESKKSLIEESSNLSQEWELEERLNWFLSELSSYED